MVLDLSEEDQDYYHMQKNHYQTIKNTYTDWYARCCQVSQNSNSTYFYCEPWDIDFDIPVGAPKTQLDGFLNET